jgi:hypothetical protein
MTVTIEGKVRLLSAISVCGTLRDWNVERFCPNRVCGEVTGGEFENWWFWSWPVVKGRRLGLASLEIVDEVIFTL